MIQLLDAEESDLTLYRGEFTFADRKNPPSGAQVTITNNYTAELVGVYTPRQRDGQFSAILAPNTSYHLVYEADDYESYEEDIFVPAGSSYQEIYKDIKLKPVRVDAGKSQITPIVLETSNIAGNLTIKGKAKANSKIVLYDEAGNILQETITDNTGEFKFTELNPSKTYLIRAFSDDGSYLKEFELNVMNDKEEKIPFERLDDSTYIFVPSSFPYEFYGIKSTSIFGQVKRNNLPLAGLIIRLEDEGGKLLKQAEADQAGEFKFSKLSLDNAYRIKFEGDFPNDLSILITDDDGNVMTFRRVSEGVYEYVPPAENKTVEEGQIRGVAMLNGTPLVGVSVHLEDAKKNTLQSTETDNAGEFNFNKLDLDNRYRIVFDGEFPSDADLVFTNNLGEELKFMKVKDGVYEYVPRPSQYAFKSYTIGIEDNPDYQETYPKPEELKDVIVYYQKYFPYNDKDINASNKEFLRFIDDIADLVKARGYADIIITSSASKVPTKTWKSNSILTKRRANDTQRLLEKAFKSKGLSEDQFNFVDINTLITGPEYSNDAVKNRSMYEKHQYVRIFIK